MNLSILPKSSTDPCIPQILPYRQNSEPIIHMESTAFEPPNPLKSDSNLNLPGTASERKSLNEIKNPSIIKQLSIIRFEEQNDNENYCKNKESKYEITINEIKFSSEPQERSRQPTFNLRTKNKSVSFALNVQNNLKARRKFQNYQKCSEESEIMQFVLLKNKNFLKKLLFFIRKFLISHLCAASITILLILIQNLYGKYCYMPPNCLCQDDIQIKTFVFFKEFFSYWMLFIVFFIQSVFTSQLFPEKTSLKKGLFVLISAIYSFFWILFSSERNYIPLLHYLFLLFLSFVFELNEIIKTSQTAKEKLLVFLKINQFAFVLFINYLFYLFVYQTINTVLLMEFDEEFAKNIISFYISIYTLTITYLLKRVVLNYSQFLIKISKRNTHAVISSMRAALCLFISIPAANMLKMNIFDWGGWFLIISYGNFLIGFYFKVDFFGVFIEKIKIFFMKKGVIVKIDLEYEKNRIYIEKLLSGCVLDVQLVCCLRILILYISQRWSGAFLRGQFYKNCSFEIESKEFQINAWGIVALVTINVSLAIFVFFYMIKRQNQLILYKIKHNYFANVYLIFLNHFYIEAMINMFYLYIHVES